MSHSQEDPDYFRKRINHHFRELMYGINYEDELDNLPQVNSMHSNYNQYNNKANYMNSAPPHEYTPYEIGTIYKYRWIDCQDEYNKWYEAQIIDMSSSQRMIKVHYKGWSSKYDTWVNLNTEPERVRLLHTFTTKPKVTGTLSSYRVGTKCDCLDPKDKWYQAEIVQVNEENDLVKIHYNGWDKRYDEWINKDSYRIAPRRRNKISPRKSKPKRNTSSPMDRNVTINNDQRRINQQIPKPMPSFASPFQPNYDDLTPPPTPPHIAIVYHEMEQKLQHQYDEEIAKQLQQELYANDENKYHARYGLIDDAWSRQHALLQDQDIALALRVQNEAIVDNDMKIAMELQKEEELRAQVEDTRHSYRTYECSICLSKYVVAEDAFFMDCDHVLHRKCALAAFKADIMTYKRLPRCPQCQTEKVKTEITPQQLELLLDDKSLGFYRDLSLAQGLKGSNYFQCPTADCQNGAELIGNDVLLFRCESCKFSSCTRCRGPYHPNELCEELLNEKRLEALAKQKGWKPCPKCGIIIERIVGCFHMKCKNPQCGAEYCDQCGAQLDPENWRVHFNPPNKCKLWMDENDLLYLD